MRSKRIYWTISLIILAVLLAMAYYFFDPVEAKWMPKCLWKVATGTDCPGCGSQRMAHSLMHGDFIGAWHANAFAICMLPVVAVLLWFEVFREKYPRVYGWIHSPWMIWILLASIFLWWILRNLA